MEEKIGVLFVHSQEGFGADAAVHADLMRHLDRERFEVHVACTAGDGQTEPPALCIMRTIPGLRVRPTQFAPGFRGRNLSTVLNGVRSARAFPRDFWDLRRYVKANRIRLIHSTDRPRDAVYGVLLGRATGAKSIVHVHVKWSKIYSFPARWAVNNSSAVFSISNYVTGTVAAMGRPLSEIHTVPNAIDLQRWDPTIDGSSLRRELGVAAGAPLLASVSRLFSWKGQRELLQAFAQVRGEIPDAKLLIVGADAPAVHGGSFTAELKALAAQLGLSEHVVFTGARSDIPEVMAACDVFTLPSFEEPFGLVFLEAMAMAKPVVAIDNGGTPEVVEHERSGLLSPPWEIAALARNIVTLLRDPELRARYGRHGRQRVEEYFNAQRMARDAERAYEKVLRS
jgi:glycosyltransferase involved in cell wall biosynthesis